jgi:hypothetical protein
LPAYHHVPEGVQRKGCPLNAGEGPKGGRPKGLPKTGGRRQGTPNRSTVALREILAVRNYDPILRLVDIADDSQTPRDLRVQIHLGIAPYVYPKRKPVDELIEEPMVLNVITTLDDDDDDDSE